MEKYVLTGGPGVGKTTMIKELKKIGYQTLHEVATEIIKEGKFLPLVDLKTFQKEVFRRQKSLEEKLTDEPTILDRGLGDCIAYYRFGGYEAPRELKEEARKADYKKIFILNSLKTYRNTKIRYENKKEAKKIHKLIFEAYKEMGYRPIKVPPLPIKERVELIKKRINQGR